MSSARILARMRKRSQPLESEVEAQTTVVCVVELSPLAEGYLDDEQPAHAPPRRDRNDSWSWAGPKRNGGQKPRRGGRMERRQNQFRFLE